MPIAHILVIGSSNTDMVIESPTLPRAGETVLGGQFRIFPGGKGANQAVAAVRAGAIVQFISVFGDDDFGRQSREILTLEGIDLSHQVIKKGAQSGVALIMVDSLGENIISVAPGANALLESGDLIHAAPAFLGTNLLIMQLEIPLDTVTWAAAYAKKLSCPLLLNPAPMPTNGLSDHLLSMVDILTPNEGELRALAPGADSMEKAAKEVLARGPRLLVVTRGANGVNVFSANENFHQPIFPIAAIDTVGAGDCFSATLGVAWAEGKPLKEAVRFASAAAALSTSIAGAQTAMPVREIIERMMAEPNL